MKESSLFEFLENTAQQELDELSKIKEPKRSGLAVDQLGLKPGGGVHNIVTVYNQATPEEKEYWGKWYHNAKSDVEDLALAFKLPFPVAAAIVAVLSPGNKWNGNLSAAEKLLRGEEKINAYPRQVLKAKEILKKGDTKLVTGPKVTVFFKSLMDPSSVEKDMVLDGHAINIWRGAKENLKGLKNPSAKERAQMIQDYQEAAKQLGVPVQAVQATTWYIWKYTGKTAPLPVEKGVYDVSKFVGAKPANDVDAIMEEFLDEFNAMGTGAVQGYTGPLGGDPEPTHKKMWSNPKNEGKGPKMEYNPMPSELWEIEWPIQENVLDQMGQKHVGGASRKSPYGDTYVGFSSGKNEDESGREKQSKIVKKVNKNLDKKPYTTRNPPGMGISITRPSLKDRK